MIKKITLLILLFSVKILSAQKITTLNYKGKNHMDDKAKHSFAILSKTPQTTTLDFSYRRLQRVWLKKTPKQVNDNYKNLPNVTDFVYNSKTKTIKLTASTSTIRTLLLKEFRFSPSELTRYGL